MTVYKSKTDTQSSIFLKNENIVQKQVNALNDTLSTISKGGHETARQRHTNKGKLLPRERLRQLCDPDTTFLELSPLAAHGVYPSSLPAAGLITGIGWISGVECMIIVNDATVKGGTYYPLTVKKHLRAQEIAEENYLPCIYLVDSGGAFLPKQDEVFPDKEHFGRIFYNQAQLSAKHIPQIAVVMGSCTAGGAYIPAMSDEVIMVKEQATIFLAGPPLVQAATGEKITAEALGGADTHCRKSGVADYYADDDADALRLTRSLVARLNRPDKPLTLHCKKPCDPRYPIKELYGLIPHDRRQIMKSREIIARLVDNSEFDEFKALYGTTLICAFAHLNGYPVGIIANQGILLSDSALKGTHFIELCCHRKIPLIFLQNTTGFMVGSQHEANGIAKHGAKLVTAVACAQIPKFTIITGGSFGAGNYALCGRAYQPRFLWMWPNARIAVMGGEQAAHVLTQIAEAKHKKLNQAWTASDAQKMQSDILKTIRSTKPSRVCECSSMG